VTYNLNQQNNNMTKNILLLILSFLLFSTASYASTDASEEPLITDEDTITEEAVEDDENPAKTPPPANINSKDQIEANSAEIDQILNELSKESQTPPPAPEEKSTSGIVIGKKAKLIILNKITAKSSSEVFAIGTSKKFGNVTVQLSKCAKDTNPYKPNNFVLVNISDQKPGQEKITVFKGWLMSADPSISTVEHPVYEIIPVECL